MLRRRQRGQAQLLDKQKGGEEAHATFGKVDIPQEAFIAALNMNAD